MKNLNISEKLQEKIYDYKFNKNNQITSITSYFPLTDNEKHEIFENLKGTQKNCISFKSIFTDEISDGKWEENKLQIKKKFRDELIDID